MIPSDKPAGATLDASTDPSISFAVGTGRCGTHTLQRLLAAEPDFVAFHERQPLNATFHRYCQWNGIPIDDAGFLACKEQEITSALSNHRHYHEASAYLSLSIRPLYRHFRAKILFLVRHPVDMVNSYLAKGWYEDDLYRHTHTLPPSYQPGMKMHHFLGRIVPSGEEYERWREMSRVGKLAWFWRILNEAVIDQLSELPADSWRRQAIEQLDFDAYREIVAFLGAESKLKEGQFQQLTCNRPEAFSAKPTRRDWNEKETAEFLLQTGGLPRHFGYFLHAL